MNAKVCFQCNLSSFNKTQCIVTIQTPPVLLVPFINPFTEIQSFLQRYSIHMALDAKQTTVQVCSPTGDCRWVTLDVLAGLLKTAEHIVLQEKSIQRRLEFDNQRASMIIWPWFAAAVSCGFVAYTLFCPVVTNFGISKATAEKTGMWFVGSAALAGCALVVQGMVKYDFHF
jgi:hypothetical protein